MAYKRIRVWSGTGWQEVGAQVPAVVDAAGQVTTALIAGARTVGVSFDNPFAFPPYVFVQITGQNHATVTVEVNETGFTAYLKGTGTDAITFNWFAVQINYS